MDFPHGEPVARLRGTPGTPPYNEIDWSSPDSVEYPRCAVWQESSTEPGTDGVDSRDVVITVTKAALPFSADVLAGDRFIARGITYEVVGEPEYVHSPFTGWEPGTVVTGRRVDG